jgi:LuxR family maltose regulon positive regulatory protein
MSGPILATKLLIPPARKNLVTRPRLSARLDECLQPGCRLALVSAPAGFGKTTLVSTWAAGLKSPEHRPSIWISWLSLDEGDNDPVIFWTYVITALQSQQAEVGKQAQTLLQSSQPPNPEAALSLLVNDLAQIQKDLILILEDFHLIRSPTIHHSLSFLIDHAPPQFHGMVLSRTDPPLPLALWRGRGQLLEIRQADLRFSNNEAENYLIEAMKLALSPPALKLLITKTEGWVAGLQMAAVSLRNQENADEFVASFSGSNRFILDYLIEEVLKNQPPEIQEFLLQTSFLDTLCSPLCDALLRDMPWGPFPDSHAILDYLENYNLFIVSLDENRTWYRYHHLFADLLRAKMSQTAPEDLPVLLRRAAEWFEKNGMLDEAVVYLHKAKENDGLILLIERNLHKLIKEGHVSKLTRWVRLLPAELALNHPWLCILTAWWHIEKAQMEEATPLLERSEKLAREENSDLKIREMLGAIFSLRTQILETRGDISGTIATARQALELLDPSTIPLRASVDYSLGRAYYDNGDLAQADQVWSEFIRIALKAEIYSIYAVVIGVRSNILGIQGKLNEAMELSRQAIDFINATGSDRFFLDGGPFLSLGIMAYQRNDLIAAESYIEEGVKRNLPWGNLNMTSTGLTFQARLQIAKGDLEAARGYLLEEERINQGYTPYFDVSSEFRSCRIRLYLALGDVAAAARLIEENQVHNDDKLSFRREQDHINLSRVLIAQGNPMEADSLLLHLAEAARSGGRFGRLISILNLRALALHAQNRDAEALQVLEAGLAQAEPEGYVRIFIDEGEPMEQLIGLAVQKGIHSEYASRLLAAFPVTSFRAPKVADIQKHNLGLVEPLSRREIEVLQLIAAGLANKEIAQRLCITLRTVKYHTTGIYTKLGVDGRAQATVKARDLGLL